MPSFFAQMVYLQKNPVYYVILHLERHLINSDCSHFKFALHEVCIEPSLIHSFGYTSVNLPLIVHMCQAEIIILHH